MSCLQYAHQACIQRWINEKGNRTCEICHGQFSTCFSDPPPPPLVLTGLDALILTMPHVRAGPHGTGVCHTQYVLFHSSASIQESLLGHQPPCLYFQVLKGFGFKFQYSEDSERGIRVVSIPRSFLMSKYEHSTVGVELTLRLLLLS